MQVSALPGLHPAFSYRQGSLSAEGVALAQIAATAGTPCYVYAQGAIEGNYRAYADAFAKVLAGERTRICYALKANGNQAVLRCLARLGAGADIVSGGELARARAAGIPGDRIVFAGVGKTGSEIAAALDAGIFQFNVESEPELLAIAEIAAARGQQAPVTIRVNPDVDAKTHAKISTGKRENKFGIALERAPEVAALARNLPGIRLTGLACHIGSQLTDLTPFRAAFGRVMTMTRQLMAEGHAIDRVDLGGGLGVRYGTDAVPTAEAYAAAVREALEDFPGLLIIEPGRSLVADAGLLLARVVYVKESPLADGGVRRFLILDAAMNDLVRPAMYDAYHAILPVAEQQGHGSLGALSFDVVGPVCESADVFAKDRALPAVKPGDLVAFCTAGAYGAVMSSTYNARPLVPEVLVSGDRFAVVRPRQTIEALIAQDVVPDWLG